MWLFKSNKKIVNDLNNDLAEYKAWLKEHPREKQEQKVKFLVINDEVYIIRST